MIEGLKRCQINDIREGLRDWYNRPLGQALLQQEREQLDSILPTLFGYHIVQVGCLLGDELMTSSRIRNKVSLDPANCGDTLAPSAYAYPDAMPIESGSVDVVLLPHTLEFERQPHQILREADRILIPEGHVVVLGFNPWSLWGIWRLCRCFSGKAPWCGDFLSLTRIKDWTALLGFDVVLVRRFFFRPPIQRGGILKKLSFMDKLGAKLWPRLSGAYILVARKRVATLTPIRPRWQPRRKLVGEGDLTPTAGSTRNNV
jgi:SAM-dependent methyltransferase